MDTSIRRTVCRGTDCFALWSNYLRENLYKADISIKRTLFFTPVVSTLWRFHCILSCYFKSLCRIDLRKELLIQFFSFFRRVTHLSFRVPKSVARAYIAKELPVTEYVLHFPCGIMLSLSVPSYKGP